MENNNETKELEIDLRKMFYKMKTKIVFILIATLIVGIASGLITHFCISPTYSSTVKMYVYSNSNRVTTDSTITSNELTASQDLVNTYIYILMSDTVLDAVIEDVGLDISSSALKSMISASQATNTVAFEVTVTTTSAKWSAQIANSIAKIAPDEIIRVVKAGGVEIIDYAKTPTRPSSPNMKKNVALGALIGFIVSFAIFFIKELFDSTITSAGDIEKEFDIPVLGTIPRLETVEKSSSPYSMSTPTTASVEPPEPTLHPSSAVLENIQAMKGDAKND
jgi:capsular polysaccharide biosynthesis protein